MRLCVFFFLQKKKSFETKIKHIHAFALKKKNKNKNKDRATDGDKVAVSLFSFNNWALKSNCETMDDDLFVVDPKKTQNTMPIQGNTAMDTYNEMIKKDGKINKNEINLLYPAINDYVCLWFYSLFLYVCLCLCVFVKGLSLVVPFANKSLFNDNRIQN